MPPCCDLETGKWGQLQNSEGSGSYILASLQGDNRSPFQQEIVRERVKKTFGLLEKEGADDTRQGL